MKKILITSLLTLAATTSSFGAVKAGKVGVDFATSGTTGIYNGYGGTQSLGIWWHVTDMIAIRPSLAYSSITITEEVTTPSSKTSTTTNTFGVGISVPIYLAKMNLLDLYVAPAFSYGSNGSDYTGIDAGVSLGLQVAVNDQLQFFGEMGLVYRNSTDKSKANETTTIGWFGTARSAVGVIFYFN
jgi:hypothetical protein